MQHKEVIKMNIALAQKADKTDSKETKQQVINSGSSENRTKDPDSFNRLLTNISNKLGLSKAIYQK